MCGPFNVAPRVRRDRSSSRIPSAGGAGGTAASRSETAEVERERDALLAEFRHERAAAEKCRVRRFPACTGRRLCRRSIPPDAAVEQL